MSLANPTAALGALLGLFAAVLLAAMRELNAGLAALHQPGQVGRGVLDFPTLLAENRTQTVRATVAAWRSAGDPSLANGLSLAHRVLTLDFAFIVAYVVAAAWFARSSSSLSRGLRIAIVCAVSLLALTDAGEDLVAWSVVTTQFHGHRASSGTIDFLATLTTAKLALAIGLIGLLAVHAWRRLGIAQFVVPHRIRIVLLLLGLFVALLFVRISGEQTAEVVRAWDGGRAALAGVAVFALALASWAAVRAMTEDDPARAPGDGEPELLLGLVGGALVVAGVVAATVLSGWSAALAVPGALLAAVAVLSVLVPAGAPAVRSARTARERLHTRPVSQADAGRRWARATAAAVLLVAALVACRAIAFEMLGRADDLAASRYWGPPLWFAIACAAGAAAILLVRVSLPGGPRAALGAGIVLTVVLASGAVVLFVAPLDVGRRVGALAVIAWFFAALLALVAVLTVSARRFGRRYRLPRALAAIGLKRAPTVAFLAAWVALASFIPIVDRGGYHDVRPLRDGADGTTTLDDAWTDWSRLNLGAGGPQRNAVPLVLVAASGGGVRAAAWTSLAMDCVFERKGACTKPDSTGPTTEAVNRVFAVSGTSGGSLGFVEYDAYLRAQHASADPGPRWVEGRLGDDFVAPTVAGMLFRDLPRAFLGFDASDRASLLEQSWERPWGDGAGSLREGLRSSAQDRAGRPLLLLNGTSVEDGCRFLTSPLRAGATAAGNHHCLTVADRGLPATARLADYLCSGDDVRLSTAALLSARFPFVSPSGRLAARDCSPVRRPAVAYVVDGGYVDNSGASTLLDVWRALEPKVAAVNAGGGPCVVPVFLQLDNDPGLVAAPPPDTRPRELLVPPSVLLGSIGSRETIARAEAAATFGRPAVVSHLRIADGETQLDGFWMRLTPQGHPGPQPPLGWALASTSFADMRRELQVGANKDVLERLERLLSDELTCTPA